MAAKTVCACNMVKVGILKTKEATDDPWYCGAVCLPEHRLIIVERDWRVGKIRLHDRNTGDLIAKSDELPGPWSVCLLDKIGSLLAVALESGSIQILSIQNTGPSVTIRSNKILASGLERCHGVSAIMSKELVVSGRYEDMICWCVLSLDGMMDRIHRIMPISGTGDLDGRSYLATSGDLSRVYISCYSGLYSSDNGVYGYDMKSGEHKFTYRVSTLANPRGICVDSRGYIYVCNCWDPFCIHQLTEQGEPMTVFSEDIPRWPRAICLDENKEQFLITRRESNEVLKFRLEWNEQNAFPLEILNMDERSIRIYKEALQDGNETVYNIRVMVVGQYGVGKTTLTKRLLGKDVNLSERNSTEGIDVHINCCRVSLDTCEWINEHKEDQHLRLQRVVKLLQEETQRIEADNKQEGQSKVISQKDVTHEVGVQVNVDNVHTDNEEKLNSFKIDGGQEFSSRPRPTENVSVDNEKKDPVLELIKMINKNVDKLEKNKVECATMALWDYAGQYVFYTTHQTFLTRRAIYLLVTDLTQQITDLVRDEFFFDSEGIKLCNVQELVEVWLNSIHSCAPSPEAGTPPVILVGTHLDQIPKDLHDIVTRESFKKIRLMLKDNPGRYHLADEDFAIDNTQSDTRLEALKKKIVELASHQSYWGEKVPARWLPLEQAIMTLKASSVKIVPLNVVKEMNQAGSVQIQTMEELDLFLRFHHETGTIIYFSMEGLQDKIVLEPQWLIDALKSLITAEMFILSKYPSIIDKWCDFRNQGKLSHELIDAIWMEEKNLEFHKNKEHILLLMEKLNIVARPRTFNENGDEIKVEDYFIAPCMLRQKTPNSVIHPKLNSQMESTSVLCYVFMGHSLPSPVFHRLLAACVAYWPIAKKKSENLIYCGCCVFNIDLFHSLTLYFRDYVIYARVRRIGITEKTPEFKLCIEVKNFITGVLTKIIGYLSQSLRFELHMQCPESDVDSIDSLIPVSLLQENAEFPCHCHENSHIIKSTDQLKFWFEDKKSDEEDDSSAISSLSSPASDTDRFMRIVCLLIDVGSKVLRRLLQHITVTFNCTLDQYLAKNKRDIYNLFKKKVLNQSQIDILFPPSRGNTNLDEYDITLLTVLFNSIISGVSQQERDMIHCLRENRNKIYGHAKSSKIDSLEYRSYWASITSSLMNLCKQCRDNDFENEILLDIQRIQTLTSKVQELESRKSSDDSET